MASHISALSPLNQLKNTQVCRLHSYVPNPAFARKKTGAARAAPRELSFLSDLSESEECYRIIPFLFKQNEWKYKMYIQFYAII